MINTLRFESEIASVEKINPLVSKVLIRIAYEGLNRNNSFISREAFDKAEYSLPTCMILGEYSESLEDFRGHGGKIEITDDSIKWVNTTIPYGFIDTNPEISWQDFTEESGEVRQYICATGYVWTGRYPELEDLIKNSKKQSMEIEILAGQEKDIDGNKCYEITEFIYSAFCILGNDVEPCFEGSSISAYSLDKESFKRQFNQMVAELKFSLSESYNVVEKVTVNNPVEKWKCPHCKDFIGEKELYFENEKWFHRPCFDKGEIQFTKENSLQSVVSEIAEVIKEGGNKIVPENILALLQKYSLTEENLTEKQISYSEFSIEDLEIKIKETFQKEPEVKPVAQTEFSLTSEQMESELRRELAAIETLTEVYWDEVYTCPRYYYRDHKPEDKIVIAMDEKNWYLVGLSYSVNGDSVEVDVSTMARYKVDYNPMDMSGNDNGGVDPEPDDDMFAAFTSKAKADFMVQAKEKSLTKQFEADKTSITNDMNAKLAELQDKYTALEQKLISVDAELATKAAAERETLENVIFESFATKLTDEEMTDIKAKKAEFSLQEIEDKLCAILGKKTIGLTATFSVVEPSKPLRYSIPIENPKPQSGKSWESLIKTKEE